MRLLVGDEEGRHGIASPQKPPSQWSEGNQEQRVGGKREDLDSGDTGEREGDAGHGERDAAPTGLDVRAHQCEAQSHERQWEQESRQLEGQWTGRSLDVLVEVDTADVGVDAVYSIPTPPATPIAPMSISTAAARGDGSSSIRVTPTSASMKAAMA